MAESWCESSDRQKCLSPRINEFIEFESKFTALAIQVGIIEHAEPLGLGYWYRVIGWRLM